MHNAMDDLGLIKMDYLGLETLDIIDDTLNMAGITWEECRYQPFESFRQKCLRSSL